MEIDDLAVDNRFFFEEELAFMLRTKKYEDEIRTACARPFGSGELTVVSFRGEREQEHLMHVLNADIRYLHDRDVSFKAVSAKLRREARKSEPYYDTYEVGLEKGLLTFHIVTYVLEAGDKYLMVNPLRDVLRNPLGTLCMDELPLGRVVHFSVHPVPS